MHQTPARLCAAVGALATTTLVGLVAAAPLPAAHAERTRVVSVEEDCHEVGIPRAVATNGLRPLVPARYELFALTATASRVLVTTVTCESVRVQPGSDHSPGRRTTFTIGAAQLATTSGAPSDDFYLLWYGTDNAEEAAKLRQLGMPVTFQPHTTSVITDDPSGSTLDWDLRGGGLDYTIDGVGTPPPNEPVGGGEVTWVHDGTEGLVRMTYDNRVLPASRAVVTADFSRLEPLLPILVSPVRPTNVPFTYIRGGWTLTAELVG